MTRTTIDYGIDLGTTNSAVAVMRGIEAEIIKNNEGGDVTPSAVHINKSERLLVGRLAKQRIESDPDNTASEFKLRMGTTGQAATFARTGRRMEPEELSAEVLKSLRDDVRQYTHEEIDAAVITVPAAFELNQTDATKRAAEMAGLTFAPLIQEPTAAALAYAFQSDADGQFWLVYDLGGGTFDASIVHLDQGEFSVVNHRGDNFLGGKLIDWAIVEQLLIPAMAAEHSLEGLARGAPEARKVVAALKLAAEEAKIRLSRERSVDVTVERLPRPGGGDPIDFEYELTREDVERLAAPFYARSVNICRAALAEARLEPKAIERVLLVGGPTLAPHLREVLDAELGIEPDISQDPLTVVARGAAIFAATQIRPSGSPVLQAGRYGLELDYRPAGPDTEPLVGGRLVSDDGPLPDGLAL
jgi:molecular chaperone DnaK